MTCSRLDGAYYSLITSNTDTLLLAMITTGLRRSSIWGQLKFSSFPFACLSLNLVQYLSTHAGFILLYHCILHCPCIITILHKESTWLCVQRHDLWTDLHLRTTKVLFFSFCLSVLESSAVSVHWIFLLYHWGRAFVFSIVPVWQQSSIRKTHDCASKGTIYERTSVSGQQKFFSFPFVRLSSNLAQNQLIHTDTSS